MPVVPETKNAMGQSSLLCGRSTRSAAEKTAKEGNFLGFRRGFVLLQLAAFLLLFQLLTAALDLLLQLFERFCIHARYVVMFLIVFVRNLWLSFLLLANGRWVPVDRRFFSRLAALFAKF